MKPAAYTGFYPKCFKIFRSAVIKQTVSVKMVGDFQASSMVVVESSNTQFACIDKALLRREEPVTEFSNSNSSCSNRPACKYSRTRRYSASAAAGSLQTPKEWIRPRIFLHHCPLFAREIGKFVRGLFGFCRAFCMLEVLASVMVTKLKLFLPIRGRSSIG